MRTRSSPVSMLARLGVALLLSLVTILATSAGASALPTAEFTFTPSAPDLGQPVTFTFTGTCDNPPCTVQWRWFQTGGSHLGTAMGSGPSLTYTFPRAGVYSVVAKITNSGSTHGSATMTHSLLVHDTFEDFDRRVGYGGWRGVADTRASGGGYRLATGTSDVASFPFSGTEVTYVARTGPSRGIAAVSVPGTPTKLVDLYSARAGTMSLPVTGLTDAAHRIRVSPTGDKNAASTGSGVTLDEFVVGSTRTDDRALVIAYNGWVATPNPSANGGSARTSSAAGASTTFSFSGSSVTWLSFKGPSQGRAAVEIDGRRVDTVDGYSAKHAWKVPHSYSGLAAGPHVIRVVVLGTHDPSSLGNRVTSDAFIIG